MQTVGRMRSAVQSDRPSPSNCRVTIAEVNAVKPWILCYLLLLCSMCVGASTDRVALVVGNAAYDVGRLSNPVNDANDIADTLRGIGFDVVLATDVDREQLLRQLAEFRGKIRPGGIALLYYSGHGVEVDGQNWLLPVRNREIRTQVDVPIYSVSAQDVLRKMEDGGARLNLVFLDACRDNPLPAGAKSTSRGLARIDSGSATLVAYATAPGRTADDGSGRNSPYTRRLKDALKTPGLSITDLVNQVGAQVQADTGGAQVPWNSGTPIWPPVVLAGTAVVQRPAADLAANEGEIRIEVSPADASVRIDGALVGSGSRTIKRPAGTSLLLRVEAGGHKAIEERVLIEGGQVATLRFALEPSTATPSLTSSGDDPGPSYSRALVIRNWQEKVNYATGIELAQQLVAWQWKQELDLATVAQGIDDVMSGRSPQVSDEAMKAAETLFGERSKADPAASPIASAQHRLEISYLIGHRIKQSAMLSELGSYDRNFLLSGFWDGMRERTPLVRGMGEVRLQLLETAPESTRVVIRPQGVARHRLYVFADIDCGYSRMLFKETEALLAQGVQVEYLYFPRAGEGSESFRKAEATWCASDRLSAMRKAYVGDDPGRASCSNPVQQHLELGRRLGLTGTPTMFLETGVMVPGYVPAATLLERIAKGK